MSAFAISAALTSRYLALTPSEVPEFQADCARFAAECADDIERIRCSAGKYATRGQISQMDMLDLYRSKALAAARNAGRLLIQAA